MHYSVIILQSTLWSMIYYKIASSNEPLQQSADILSVDKSYRRSAALIIYWHPALYDDCTRVSPNLIYKDETATFILYSIKRKAMRAPAILYIYYKFYYTIISIST